MDKAHEVQKISFSSSTMSLQVDGKKYKINISAISKRLTAATKAQKDNFEISPAGYGIHWPDLDEDLSIDGLIGVKHAPAAEEHPGKKKPSHLSDRV